MRPYFLLALALAVSDAAPAQTTSKPPTRNEIVAAARAIIAKARYATFVTLGAKGEPRARIVDPFAPDAQFVVWVATNSATRKVTEIKRDQRVVISWFDPANPGYVSLSGNAVVINDAREKAAHWKDEWQAFYKNGNKGADYSLIRIKPLHMEVVSNAAGLNGDPKNWRPAMIDF
jgi:general stress protein 26